jgi:uncharacterized protein (DUF2141 family)
MSCRLTRFILLLVLCAGGAAGNGRSGLLLAQPRPDSVSVLQVTVQGVSNREGHMLLALFASPDGFPRDADKAVRRMESSIDSSAVAFLIPGVPRGRYACSALHDKNENRKMDTKLFGIPKEGYAFSQNARERFGPPSFDKAAFDVTGDTVTIVIDLVYH